MSSSLSSAFATLMMFAALFGLPAIAVFGVPDLQDLVPDRAVQQSTLATAPATEQKDQTEINLSESDLFAPIKTATDTKTEPSNLTKHKTKDSAISGDPFFRSLQSSNDNERAEKSPQTRQPSASPDAENPKKQKWSPSAKALAGWEIDSTEPAYKTIQEKDLPSSTTPLETTKSNTSPFGSYQSGGNTQLAVNKSDKDSARLVSATNPNPKITWPEVQQRLNALGIRHFQLTPNKENGKFLFRCMYKDPAPRRMIVRLFEAEADEPLVAIEDVLQQIEIWQQSQP